MKQMELLVEYSQYNKTISHCILKEYNHVMRRFSFETMKTRDNYTLLAVLNHQLAMDPVTARGQSAHFWKSDCFECLSPQKSAA
ncbi:MAG: hypothetical protein LBD23_17090 [Oscillospiraceae bacterium]|nr:hypothetical protein [Oscillospiraceae bacterium]